MEVQTISQQAFSIIVTEEELSRRRLAPEAVTPTEALAIVSEVTGRKPSGPARLELFPGRHELLIFVLEGFGKLRFFRFLRAEDIIEAALSGSFTDPSTLFYYEKQYILAVWCEGGREPASLGEYAEELPWREGILSHLYEHGRTVADARCQALLLAAFA